MYKVVVTAGGDKLCVKLCLQPVEINGVKNCSYSMWI